MRFGIERSSKSINPGELEPLHLPGHFLFHRNFGNWLRVIHPQREETEKRQPDCSAGLSSFDELDAIDHFLVGVSTRLRTAVISPQLKG